MTESVSVKQFREALAAAAETMCASKAELGRLDAAGGDGDLGATMERGFRMAGEFLAGASDLPPSSLVRGIGEILSDQAPSTLGTLLGISFVAASDTLVDQAEVSTTALVAFLDAVNRSVMEMGRVTEGNRTVVDAMAPAVRAGSAAEKSGEAFHDVLAAIASAANQGAEATARMAPTVGRARWAPNRAVESVDAGARAWALWLHGLNMSLSAERE